tara:strand:- start:16676 stop:17044 length:369 start_codon:yes stop_codon:yes gene_type:complete
MKITKFEPVKTVLTLTIVLVGVFIYKNSEWILFVAFGIGTSGLLSNKIANTINLIWSWVATVLGYIMPNILLTGVYYLFLTPIALLFRVFGEKNSLILKNTVSTTFRDSNKEFKKNSFEKMW